MGWLRIVGSMKLWVSFAKEPYKRDDIPQKRPMILSILLTVATPYSHCIQSLSIMHIYDRYFFHEVFKQRDDFREWFSCTLLY